MLYSAQRVITALSERIDLGDESVYLRGAASQAMTIDGSGAGAASPGASFRLINDCDHDATFTPGAPQTVLGQDRWDRLGTPSARRRRPCGILASVVMFLASLAPACDGNAFCPDCKTCPSLCPAGYVCKESTLIEFGGAKSYHCGLAETKPALTGAAPAAAPPTDAGVCGAMCDAGVCATVP